MLDCHYSMLHEIPKFDLYYAAYTTGRSSQGTDFRKLQRMRLSDSGVVFCDLDGRNVTLPVLTFRFVLYPLPPHFGGPSKPVTDQKHLMRIPSTSADLGAKYTPSLNLMN
jgi:hypothetical protein